MKSFKASSTLATTLLATIVTLNVPACTQAVDSSEPTQGSSDELFLTGKTWPGNTVNVCYVSGASSNDVNVLIPEAQRTLAASWSRATQLKFQGRSPQGAPQAAWGPCDLSTSTDQIQFYSTIALHFCNSTSCGTTNNDNLGQYRGLSSPIGRVEPQVIVDSQQHVSYAPGITDVYLINNESEQYLNHFRYEVIHEFGHALGFRHEQDRNDNGGRCTPAGAVFPTSGTYETSFFDNESIMSYCSFDPLLSLTDPKLKLEEHVTLLSAGDIVGSRKVYTKNASSHGFMIQTDGDTSLAITPDGAAVAGAPLKLASGCTVANPNCTWTYQRGMLISDADPTLAIAGIGNATGPVTLQPAGFVGSTNVATGRTVVCTPDNPDCTWTYTAGEFVNDHFTTRALNGHGGSLLGAPIWQTASCTTTNGSCTWTMPNVMLTSFRDSTLNINSHGGSIDHAPSVMHNGCDTQNGSCTFTFAKGMMKSTGNLALALNAYGGAHEGGTTLINSSCTVTNPSCTWTWKRGQLTSDDKSLGTFRLGAGGGAVHLANVVVTAGCSDTNPDCVFLGLYAKN